MGFASSKRRALDGHKEEDVIRHVSTVGIYVEDQQKFLEFYTQEHRVTKRWDLSDKIRSELGKCRILLEDKKEGTTCRKT